MCGKWKRLNATSFKIVNKKTIHINTYTTNNIIIMLIHRFIFKFIAAWSSSNFLSLLVYQYIHAN